MPKFIGRTIPGASEIQRNAPEIKGERIRLTYSQAKLLLPEDVMYSEDTTDKGSKNSLAKRWHRWFATPLAIIRHPKSTPNMLARAAK